MTYTEIKERNQNKYYYQSKSIRQGNSFKKKRIYLGKNLSKNELNKLGKVANKMFQFTVDWPIKDKSFFNYSSVMLPHQISVLYTYSLLQTKYPDYTLDWYFSYFSERGDKSSWMMSQDDQYTKANRLFDNPKVLQQIYKQWMTNRSELHMLVENTIKNCEINKYSSFMKIFSKLINPVMIIESFYMGHDRIINKLLQKYPKHRKEINILVEPRYKPFHHKERESILRIALMIKQNMNEKIIHRKLIEHTNNFYWIHNNYKYTKPINIDYFYEEAVNIQKEKENLNLRIKKIEDYEKLIRTKHKKIYETVSFTKREKTIFQWSSKLASWQDERKVFLLKWSYICNLFIEKIAKKYNYSVEQLQHADIYEIMNLLKGKSISKKILEERMNHCLQYIHRGEKFGIISGQEALLVKKALITSSIKKEYEIRGTTGAMGIAFGKVRIIMNPKDYVLKKGEILVTGMTRPEFLPLMKNAAAVVTDEGGITSHAAIVCRELNIPCIVGCKTATKNLKDGDEVIVNANHGVVKKFKQT